MTDNQAARSFVCQSCGKVHAIIVPATTVICGCGGRRAGEIMPDPQKPDPARGGYYTVQDLRTSKRPIGRVPDYNVRGYDMHGNLLLHTWHIGDHSMKMECDAFRVARGKAAQL